MGRGTFPGGQRLIEFISIVELVLTASPERSEYFLAGLRGGGASRLVTVRV